MLRYGQRGEYDGQVRADGMVGAMENRPCLQVCLCHPEGIFNVVELVIERDDRTATDLLFIQVGDIAYPSSHSQEFGK